MNQLFCLPPFFPLFFLVYLYPSHSMLNVDYFMMVEPITQMLLPLGSNIGDQNYPLSNCHLDSFGVFFDKLVYPLTAFVKFGFSEKATKFEKKFVVLLTRESCFVRATVYEDFSKQMWSSCIIQNLLNSYLLNVFLLYAFL